jgi:c-di-GMP-binding flagellar brake protein YcgR
MTQKSGLTIRQHERESLGLRIEFVVAEQHRGQVRFSAISGAAEPHVTRGVAADISSGGMGLVCPQFVPRMCAGTVRVFDPTPVGTANDGSPIHELCFQHAVRVRRVTLDSHEPEYAIGVAFVDPAADIEERVAAVLAMAPIGGDRGDAHG